MTPRFQEGPARCWIKNGWKLVMKYREIRRGKRKGEFQVIKMNGRKEFIPKKPVPVNGNGGIA